MTKQNKLLLRKHIESISPYSTAKDEYNGIDASILLNANESPSSMLDFGNNILSDFNRYPDPSQRLLKDAIAKTKKVDPKNIFLGNGSDEATDILIRMFCEPQKDTIVIMSPTYGMYEVKAKINNVEIIDIPLVENEENFEIDEKSLFEIISEQSAKLLFICNPNNPSGTIIDRNVILRILNGFRGIVVIDEAYIDFSTSKSFLDDLKNYPNLIILQTLSKSWGLADLRVGICLADNQIIDYMNRIKSPCNISGVVQKLAIKAISDNNENFVKKIVNCRMEMAKELKKCDCVEKIFNSETNFIFVKFKDGDLVYNHLLNNGIVVRNKSNDLFSKNCLRITIGTQEENKKLLLVLKNIS